MNQQENSFRLLPSIDKLLQTKQLKLLIERVGQDVVKSESRAQLDLLRTAIAGNDENILQRLAEDNFLEALCDNIKEIVEDLMEKGEIEKECSVSGWWVFLSKKCYEKVEKEIKRKMGGMMNLPSGFKLPF